MSERSGRSGRRSCDPLRQVICGLLQVRSGGHYLADLDGGLRYRHRHFPDMAPGESHATVQAILGACTDGRAETA